MTTFDYAQSNSLLKRAVEEKDDTDDNFKGIMPSKDGALPSLRLESLDSADSNPGAIPMNDLVKSTGKTKEKIMLIKKSQHNKHLVSNESVTKTAAAVEQSEPKPVTQTQSSATKARVSKPKKIRLRKPRRAIPNEKEYIPENEQPTQSDIVGGRGGRSNHHPGNRPYWIRILESRQEYTRSRSDNEKARIANGILRYVQQELKGRFLNIDNKTKRWYILPDAVVLDKIKQALRDKYIPYWARDLKIENKTSDAANMPTNKTAANGVFSQLLGRNKATGLNPMAAFGSSFGVQNPDLVNQAVQLAAIKASRQANAAGNAYGFPGAPKVGGQVGNPHAPNNNDNDNNSNNANNQNGNKLGFLFGSSAAARRPVVPTAAIPTVDDILKCKVDQMPSFGGNPGFMAAMASVGGPQLQSIGMNTFQSSLPPTLMNSLGLGGLPGSNSFLNEHRGFGSGGNRGAPALPPTTSAYGIGVNIAPSIGVLQGLNTKTLDKYMEEKMVGGSSLGASAFGSNAPNLPSINMMSALAGTSFDTSSSHASAASAASLPTSSSQAPAKGVGHRKTDWNAMYAKALSNSK